MTDRGLITTKECDADRRGLIEVITAEGPERITTAALIHAQVVNLCFANGLSDEQLSALSKISLTILTHLESEHPDDNP